MNRDHDADNSGVDARHVVNVQDRLDPGHVHITFIALDVLGAINVSIVPNVLMNIPGADAV
jgi:hypothetical protein